MKAQWVTAAQSLLGPCIAGKIEAKEEAVAGEGKELRTRTQVLKLTSGLNEPEIDDTCIARDFVARGRLNKLAPLAKFVRSNCSEFSISFSNRFHYFRMACHLLTRSTSLNLRFSVLWYQIDKHKLPLLCKQF